MFNKSLSASTSWALYDFANTIFSATVITLYFPLYFTSLTEANRYLGLATTCAMVLAGLATPIAGRLCDKTHTTKAYLIRMTLGCISCTFFLSLFRHPALLFLSFILACLCFHLCLVFYNALLPNVAEPHRQGKVSGLGIGLGYLGIVFSLPIMHLVEKTFGMRWVFCATSILFITFSLPLFFNLPEEKKAPKIPWSFKFFFKEWRGLYQTFLHICKKPKILLFFGGNFFILDALNSTIAWFAIYAKNVFELTQGHLILLMIGLNICAFLFSLLTGYLTDKINGYFILITSSAALALLLLSLTQEISFLIFAFLSFALGAFALAGLWTAGRKVLIDLAPKEKSGEYFGVYGLITKISIVGSFFYGMTSDISGMKNGLWILVFPACCGFIFLSVSALVSKDIEIDYGY